MIEILPAFVTPDQLAAHFGFSPREVRKKVRDLGTCSILGNATIMLTQDVEAFLDALKPEPKPTIAKLLTALEMRKLAQARIKPIKRRPPAQKPEIVPIPFLREDK